MSKRDINHALVERTRPPIYTAMKYWGKKPHNIWGEYIKTYTPSKGLYLDPFAGSAISAFEAVKNNRRGIAFDLNPLTSFIIEVYSTEFDYKSFKKEFERIFNCIQNDTIYQRFFQTSCPKCSRQGMVSQHFKWENNKIYELGVICQDCNKRVLKKPDDNDYTLASEQQNIQISTWFPNVKFYNSPSFSPSFLNNLGGNNFKNLWTNRNLYVISYIFDEILKTKNENIKKQLLFGFIKTIHLCSKMCVPRRSASNRSFSTSWGRAAYICSSRQMEMNPLLLFKGNCFGRQSVQSALEGVKSYLGKVPKTKYIDKNIIDEEKNKIFSGNYDIVYGIVDINTLTDFIADKSIDFIMTDPPYGGLVQYIDLSQIWLIWLQRFDKRYKPNLDAEITIKNGLLDLDDYSKMFTKGIKKLYRVLKDNGKIVFTFHNKDLRIWNAFLRSLSKAGFKIENVIHQQNRRTGESNVANPYGTSASDFYIRCSKSDYIKNIKTTKDTFENFIVDRAKKIIIARNEPTPYQILFNGLLTELSKAGFDLENFDENIKDLLKKHLDTQFEIEKNENEKAGNLWWIKDYAIKDRDRKPLSKRVELTIKNLLKNKKELSYDDILAEIFIKYPNGLTPDIPSIDSYIKKYAYKSGEKWIYIGGE